MSQSDQIKILHRTISGTTGSLFALLVGHPLDTIRVLSFNATSSSKIRLQIGNQSEFSNSMDCLRKTLKNEGFLGLWKGVGVAALFTFPIVCTCFTGNSLGHYLQKNKKYSERWKQFNSGCFGGFLSTFVKVPVELVKNRSQIYQKEYLSMFKVIKKIISKEGTLSLYKGFLPTIGRDVPSHGIYFWTFYFTRKYLENPRDDTFLKLLKLFISGGIAGMVSTIFTYPLDLGKNIMQCDESLQNISFRKILKGKIEANGYSFLLRGLNTSLLRAVPTSGISLLLYDRLMEYFKCNFK